MSDQYPRVVLVNVQPTSRRHATGIAMGNLFRGWPLDHIAQVYCDDSEPDETVCALSWRLEVEDVPMPPWLHRRVARWRRARRATQSTVIPAEPERADARPPISDSVTRAMKAAIRRGMDFVPYAVPPDLLSALRAFGPEIIYSVLEDRRVAGVALDLSHILSVPLVPHFMDDWLAMAAHPRSGPANHWARRDLVHKALRVMREAPVRLVISEDMATAYRTRYGGRFVPFSNCVDPLERPPIVSNGDDGPFRFGFAGRMSHGRADALGEVVDALLALDASGVRTEVVVYQHEPDDVWPDRILRSSLVRLADAREEALLETADCEVNAFLHVDTFDHAAARYLHYSISGKVPWYLAAGIPLFAYGSRETGTIRFLLERQSAVVVDRRDAALLRKSLQDLVQDAALRRELGARAELVFGEHFDARVQRKAFRRVLLEASLTSRRPQERPLSPEHNEGGAV